VARFEPGDSLILVLVDGTRISGTLVDLGRIPADQYRDRYERWRQEAGQRAALPVPGARIELVTGRMGMTRAVLQGFGQDGIEVVTEGKRPEVRSIEFSRFSSMVVPGGQRWKSQELERLCWAGDVPLLTALEALADGHLRLVPLDEVVSVQSRASATPLTPELCAFGGRSSGTAQITVEGGALWAGDPSDRRVASGLVLRASPSSIRSLGLDATFGVLHDETGDGGFGIELDLAAAGSVPMGTRFGLQPRAGAGIILGAGSGVLTVNLGAGLTTRLRPGFGVRLDYTYHRLLGEGYNYPSISSVYLGPFWGR